MNDRKKIKYNLLTNLISQFITILLGFLIPRLIMTSFGSEMNGLLESVNQIYTYVGLLEAGIGTATIQALYKTIANKDRESTQAVLSATNKYYHKTGIIYIIVIFIFAFLYPIIVNTTISTHTIMLVIIFTGMGSAISYFFQGKYFLLLQAEGKYYIQVTLVMITNIIKNVSKIILLYMGFGIVYVQAVTMLVSIIQMIFIQIYIRKHYAWIDLSCKPNYKSINQSRNVLVHQISGLVFNNTDMIMLSLFCDLKVVSIYSVYLMVYTMVSAVQSTFSSSVVFKLGQQYHSDKNKFLELMDCYELYYITFVFSLYSIATFCITPFIKLYTYGINDIVYVNGYLPFLFALIHLLSCGRNASNNTINFAGHFKQTQHHAVIEMVINLICSVIFVNLLGIYGVLLGTIVALLYRSNAMILYCNHVVLQRRAFNTYKKWSINIVLFALIGAVERIFVQVNCQTYWQLILLFIPISITTIVIFFVVSSLFNKKDYCTLKNIISKKR